MISVDDVNSMLDVDSDVVIKDDTSDVVVVGAGVE